MTFTCRLSTEHMSTEGPQCEHRMLSQLPCHLPSLTPLGLLFVVLEAHLELRIQTQQCGIGNNLLQDLDVSVAGRGHQGHQGQSNYAICLGVISTLFLRSLRHKGDLELLICVCVCVCLTISQLSLKKIMVQRTRCDIL